MSDLISRQKTIEILTSMMRNCFPEAEEELDAVITTVREIPFAEPERKKGKWETVPYKKLEHGEVVIVGDAQRCSVCRHAEKGWNKEMNFCPNCGAEMSRGE